MSAVQVYSRARAVSYLFESSHVEPPSTAAVLKTELGSVRPHDDTVADPAVIEASIRAALVSRDVHVALEIVQGLATMRASAALFRARPDTTDTLMACARGAARAVLEAHARTASELDEAIARARKVDSAHARGFVTRSHAFRAALEHDRLALEEALAGTSLRALIAPIKEALIGLIAVMIA